MSWIDVLRSLSYGCAAGLLAAAVPTPTALDAITNAAPTSSATHLLDTGPSPAASGRQSAKSERDPRAPGAWCTGVMADALPIAVERGDVDELIRLVDSLCATREWDRLVGVRDRCEAAIARGRPVLAGPAPARNRPPPRAPGRFSALPPALGG